jgi:hypothetical protein
VPAFELARGKFGKRVVLFTYEASVHADLVAGADEWWTFETNRSAVERRG